MARSPSPGIHPRGMPSRIRIAWSSKCDLCWKGVASDGTRDLPEGWIRLRGSCQSSPGNRLRVPGLCDPFFGGGMGEEIQDGLDCPVVRLGRIIYQGIRRIVSAFLPMV